MRRNTGRERRPEPPSIEKVQALGQTDEVWGVIARRARMWRDPDDAPPYRPYMVLVGPAGSRQVLRSEIFEAPPGAEDVEATLLHAMRHPALFTGRPRRPAIVESDDEALVAALTPRLARVGVRCRYRAALLELDRSRADLERGMVGAPIPGLLSVPGVTEPRARRLFALAAEYYERAPWRYLGDMLPIEIRYPPDAAPRFGVVMGAAGEVFGLSVTDTEADLALMFARRSGPPPFARISWTVLIFEVPRAMTFDDLDDLERYGWEVAGPEAYPMFGRTDRRGRLVPPRPDDVSWYEAALAALVEVLPAGSARPGRPPFDLPYERTVDVTTPAGPGRVDLRIDLRVF